MRTSVKLESGRFLTLSTKAVGFTCFEFLKVRWVEHVALSLLSGRDMLGDKAARDGVLAGSHPPGRGRLRDSPGGKRSG